ncbi:FkbM family methyltransferase [Nitrosococcus wardiae]|uniref:FkbM family methyltransferase n=1 Tax=Nitrosococcus wardiae TaxID=1814290 RepID=UPI00141AF07A|nr:FkbM family methyltransferase [Nitrosococcus wardiae]
MVLDVGANIGLFAWRVLRTYPQARIFCFEPAPPTFEILKKNLQGQSVEMFLEGVADFDGEGELSYYPLVPGNSTLHPRQLDSELMDKMFVAFRAVESRWWARLIGRPLFRALVRKVWDRPQHMNISIRRLSTFLAERPELDVDLLKVDVERAEWQVLCGIEGSHWPRIQQLAIEGILGSGLVGCFLLNFVVMFVLWLVLYVLNFLVRSIM